MPHLFKDLKRTFILVCQLTARPFTGPVLGRDPDFIPNREVDWSTVLVGLYALLFLGPCHRCTTPFPGLVDPLDMGLRVYPGLLNVL